MSHLFRRAMPLLALLAGAATPAPPEIHVNQIGFRPDTAKRAVVASAARSPLEWRLRGSDGRIVSQGVTRVVGPDAASGDHVHLIAFDGVRQQGEYQIEVAGAVSRPFPIRTDVYAPLARASLNFFYQQRAGTWRPLMNPHHRFWARQLDPSTPGPPPGVVSGGPNSTSFADPVGRKLQGKCAPQRCWVDHIDSYAMNEVAINWNAPLVWVAAYLDRDSRSREGRALPVRQ